MELLFVVIGSVVFVVILVSVLLGCSMCQNRSGFKDFSDAVELEIPSGVYTVEDDSMFAPPFDSVPNTPHKVEFEPLPPVDKIKGVQLSSVLLPKISQVDGKKLDSISDIKCEFSRNQVQYIKELGNGWFGKALLGEAAKISVGMKRTKVVIKMLNEEASKEECIMFMEEVKPYRELNHTNILKLLGECTEVSPFLTILEYFPTGDLKSFLLSHKEQRSSLAQQGILLNFACELASGLACLHQYKYVHHDLALRNCLVTPDMSVKIGDYGVSEDQYKADYYTVGSETIPLRWCAPESLELVKKQVTVKPFTLEANIWSFGVCLWEIFEFARQPYCELSNDNVIEYVILQKKIKLPKPFLHTADVQHMDKLYELMEHCWLEPTRRPDITLLNRVLLHLISQDNMTGFDDQWNNLLPRSKPGIANAESSDSSVNGQLDSSDRCFSTNFLPPQTNKQNASGNVSTQDDSVIEAMHDGTVVKSSTELDGYRDDSFSSPPPFGGHVTTSTPVKSPQSDSSEYATANSTIRTHGASSSEYNSCQDSTLKGSEMESTLPYSGDDTPDASLDPVSV